MKLLLVTVEALARLTIVGLLGLPSDELNPDLVAGFLMNFLRITELCCAKLSDIFTFNI